MTREVLDNGCQIGPAPKTNSLTAVVISEKVQLGVCIHVTISSGPSLVNFVQNWAGQFMPTVPLTQGNVATKFHWNNQDRYHKRKIIIKIYK